jgi:nucleoid-associated protein YgaU
MNRLTLISTLAIVVLAVAIGLIWVMDEQDRDDLAQSSVAASSAATTSAPAQDDSQAPSAAQAAAASQSNQGEAPAPSFDIVRVNPSGDTVIAGRAEPGSTVTILDQGASIGSAQADDNGEWVFLPKGSLDPGEHSLTLESVGENGAAPFKSQSAVVVVVPEIAKDIAGNPVSAPAGSLAVEIPQKGGGAVRILNLPSSLGTRAPGEDLAIAAVDYGEQGSTAFSGRAPANSKLIAYLNNQPVAEIKTDPAGRWSIEGASPVGKGPHRFRVDQVNEKGKVISRAEIMFELVQPQPELSAQASDVRKVIVVQPGQNLWLLARRNYGEGMRYTIIFDANRSQITDPDLIFPGQVLEMPPG